MNNKEKFCHKEEDCHWLKETHLTLTNLYGSSSLPDFKSFDMFGNEDSPEHILLYKERYPNIESVPIAEAFQLSTGKYIIIKDENLRAVGELPNEEKDYQ